MDMLLCAREAEERWQRQFAGKREPVMLSPGRGGARASFLSGLVCTLRALFAGPSIAIRECAYQV